MNKANKHREGRGEESAAYEMFSEWASHTNIKIQQADWMCRIQNILSSSSSSPPGWKPDYKCGSLRILESSPGWSPCTLWCSGEVWSEEAGGGGGNGLHWKCWNCGSNLIGLCFDCHQLWRINSLANVPGTHICNPINTIQKTHWSVISLLTVIILFKIVRGI